MKKKRIRIGLLLALGLAATALAQEGTFEFKAKNGQLTISNPGGSMKGTRISKDPERYKIIMRAPASGQIVGTWSAQNLTLRSKTFEAETEAVGSRTELQVAHLGGGVTATALRPSGQQGVQTRQTITLTAPTVDFFGADNRAELKGGVTVDQKDPAAETTLNANGSSGTVVLTDADDKNEKRPVQSAVLQGNARITLTSVRTVTEREPGKPPARVKHKFTITLTGDRVHFQIAKAGNDYGVITVTGDVQVDGDDPIVIGKIRGAKKIVIKLDKDMEPYDIDTAGDPAVFNITEKKGG